MLKFCFNMLIIVLTLKSLSLSVCHLDHMLGLGYLENAGIFAEAEILF